MRKIKNSILIVLILAVMLFITTGCYHGLYSSLRYEELTRTTDNVSIVYVRNDRQTAREPINYDILYELSNEEMDVMLLGISEIFSWGRGGLIACSPPPPPYGLAIKLSVRGYDTLYRFMFSHMNELISNGFRSEPWRISADKEDFHNLISQFVDISEFV